LSDAEKHLKALQDEKVNLERGMESAATNKESAEYKAAVEIVQTLNKRIEGLQNHAKFIAEQGGLGDGKSAGMDTLGGILGSSKLNTVMNKMEAAAKFSKTAADTQLDVFESTLPKDELALKKRQLMDGLAQGQKEIDEARKATEAFFKKGSTAVNKVMDHCMEELGISYGTLFVILVGILVVLASTFLFVFSAASAFLGPEGSAAIQSVLVGLAGAVSSVFSKSNADKSREEATGGAMERVTEIIESQVKAVVGKMGAINDDSLQAALSGGSTPAVGGGEGTASGTGRGASNALTAKETDTELSAMESGQPEADKIFMANLLKTVKRNNPEKFKGIKQVCKTEDEEKHDVQVVQVYADMAAITDPAFHKMQTDINQILSMLNRLSPMEQPLHFRKSYDLLA